MARPKVLVFQHVPFEPLGTLDPLLKNAGFRIRYVNFGRQPESRPRLDGYEALIILGGPMNSDQIDSYPNLITEVEIIREATGVNKPITQDETRIRPAKSEVFKLISSADRLAEATGWSPALGLEAGLSRTVDWWREEIREGRVRPDAGYLV